MSVEAETIAEVKIAVPHMYKVILLNDDFTPMQFVVEVLLDIFNKSMLEAQALMMEIHQKGRGIAGLYTKEIAEQKVIDTVTVASHYGHPLKAICEQS